MKISTLGAATAVLGLSLTLTACGGGDDSAATTSSQSSSATTSAAAAVELPTAADLNAVLATATDPNATVEQKVATVQGSETAPELFEVMTASKAESGADFQVVDPVLPGYTTESVLATVNFTLPDRPAQVADNVEFVYEDGTWKLSDSWACTLISSTVPDQLPEMCQDKVSAPIAQDPAPAPEAPAEAPAEAPEAVPAQ